MKLENSNELGGETKVQEGKRYTLPDHLNSE